MGLWSRCTLRWLLATGSGFLASKLSRLPLSQRSFARGRAQSNSTIPKLSSPWCTRRSGHHLGSWRPLTRHQGPTCLCNLVGWGMSSGLLDRSIFESFCQRPYQWMFLLGIVLFKNIRKTKELSLSMWFPNPCFVFILILLWHIIVIFSFRRVETPRSSGCGSLYSRFSLLCF